MGRHKQSDLLKLRRRYFVTQAQMAELFGVTARTIRNWERGNAPQSVLAYFRIAYERDLGALHPAWKGFRIGLNGKLYGPNRLELSAMHLRHWESCIRCWYWTADERNDR